MGDVPQHFPIIKRDGRPATLSVSRGEHEAGRHYAELRSFDDAKRILIVHTSGSVETLVKNKRGHFLQIPGVHRGPFVDAFDVPVSEFLQRSEALEDEERGVLHG